MAPELALGTELGRASKQVQKKPNTAGTCVFVYVDFND